jgi:FxsC-like protein
VSTLADLANAFATAPRPTDAAPPPGLSADGPRHVQCVYVAATRGEMVGKGVRTAVDGYGEESGMEWSPYHPRLRDEIGLLVNAVTAGEGFLYTYTDVDEHLVERLEDAKKRNKIVVLLVDAWTLCLDSYQERMREVDERSFFNTAILVPWNPEDPETAAQRAELQVRLEATFLDRYVTRDQFADAIETVEDLKNELKVALTRAKMRLINAAQVRKRVGEKTMAKPTVAGPGGPPPPPMWRERPRGR